MQEQMYDNLWIMFQDMKAHTNSCRSNFVCSNDDKRLLIGWQCNQTNYYFRVRLSDLRTRKAIKFPLEDSTLNLGNFSKQELDLAYDMLTEFIIDQKGRQKIADLMSWNGQESSAMDVFSRLIKLKAFW